MVAVAVIYTTPWDNYLVATRVWWYDPRLVTGITLWWVPIEEYTFFVVQTLMVGLWIFFLMRRLPEPQAPMVPRPTVRWRTLGVLTILWAISTALLLGGWTEGRYMTLLLSWVLLPMMLQALFGADILWHHGKLVALGITIPTLYLWVVDALAMHTGTWTINPANTVGIYLGPVLPLEEMVFFLVTNVLIICGMTLLLAPESHRRLAQLMAQAGLKAKRS